jgi:glyoxylase-like metal-dependent hydrolase (beta-lactamase superfamily II)
MVQVGVPMAVDENTFFIDIGFFSAAGILSVYVIKGDKTCIIDSGTSTEVSTLCNGLRTAGAFPPDIVALTHAHYDHSQGVPRLRELAAREGKEIEVFASEAAVRLLEDQSYNRVFDEKGRYADITDVTPLKEGEILDLGGETIEVINTPGHSEEHISFLHKETERLFVGDSLGMHLGENSYVPPFMPANWNLEAFHTTIEKLKHIEFKQLCFAHFGCISDEKSRGFLDFALEQTELWWKIFEDANKTGMVQDYDYLTERILSDSGLVLPDIELLSAKLRFGLGLLNGVRRIRGKSPLPAAQVLMHDYVVPWLSKGYRIYKKNKEQE